jgi:hypothetical protein
MRALDKVVAWARARGVTVRFDGRTMRDSEWDPGTRVITIGHCGKRSQLYVLLHECGHFLIGATGPRHSGRVGSIEEEIIAWRRGRSLARRLRIRVDSPAFARLRSRCLATYVRWAAKKPSYTPPDI